MDAKAPPAVAAACGVIVDANFGASSKAESGDFEGVVPIDLALDDERRMKQELVAWAKAVASMAIRAYQCNADVVASGVALPQPAAACVAAVEVARPWSGDGGASSSTEGRERDLAMDVALLWDDEGRMKRELVAWAKAVASMAIRESMRC
ncbi:hypothetical protein ZWY2020_056320 [Hordeum vulgare]|nr:hypothetical protein ZWY2020_056320 [Hordeum vulgare]